MQIDWPVPPGKPPLRTTHRLTERCCYWSYYDSKFKVPDGIAIGTATARVSLSTGAFPFEMSAYKFTIPARATPSPDAVK